MTTTTELNDLFRWCDDIGQFAIDRPINDTTNHKGSCVHKTKFCMDTCFNNKLYKLYPKMHDRDDRIESIWQNLDPYSIKPFLQRKRKQTKRVRLMTRGEAFVNYIDVHKVRNIVEDNPNTDWWIPTRAWHNNLLKSLIEKVLFPIKNVAINASLDPSDSKDDWNMLRSDGWNIMFYGDEDLTNVPDSDIKMFLCPKTHKKLKGHCDICKAGCFSPSTLQRQQFVHLSQH
jgi:hypothetical protein